MRRPHDFIQEAFAFHRLCMFDSSSPHHVRNAQRSTISRLVAPTAPPTNPVPASTRRFTKSIEFPLLKEIFAAAAMVKPDTPELKKDCRFV